MNTPEDTQVKQQKDNLDFVRGGVLSMMLRAGKLNDEMLNAEEGKMLLTVKGVAEARHEPSDYTQC